MGENKRDKTPEAAAKQVNPFVWFFEECKRVVRFLYDWFFPWAI